MKKLLAFFGIKPSTTLRCTMSDGIDVFDKEFKGPSKSACISDSMSYQTKHFLYCLSMKFV